MAQMMDSNFPVSSIYVGDLTPDVTEDMLYKLFSHFGNVLGVKLCRDVYTNTSLCYGYVNYRTTTEAELAIKGANYLVITEKPCRVTWSMRDASKRKLGIGNLFVKNIDPDLDSRSLYEAFSSFGSIISCKIAVDEHGVSKCHGFVQFANEKHANQAIDKINGVEFKGRPMYVSKFIAKNARVDAKSSTSNMFTNVFLKNFGNVWKPEDVRSAASKYGEITSSLIPLDGEGKVSGYGFINFSKPEDAMKCVQEMNNFLLPNGEKLFAGKSQRKAERIAYLRREREIKKKEYLKQFKDMNLYVKNFDESLTEERLKQEFSKFGTIRSARIIKDENGKSKCFAFICFSSPAEASAALKEMSSKMIDNKPLYVSIAQPKDERRKMLDLKIFNNSFKNPAFVPPFHMYPQGQFIPYPPQMPPPHGAVGQAPIRHSARSMMNNAPHFRAPPTHMYHQNGGYPPYNYRPRAQNQNQQGKPFQAASNTVVNRNPNSGYPAKGHTAQMTVNRVVTDQNIRDSVKTEDKHSESVGKVDDVFGDRVYRLCEDVYRRDSDKYKMDTLPHIATAIIEHFRKDNRADCSDSQIRDMVSSVYSSFLKVNSA